jgi:hypothetical protein
MKPLQIVMLTVLVGDSRDVLHTIFEARAWKVTRMTQTTASDLDSASVRADTQKYQFSVIPTMNKYS